MSDENLREDRADAEYSRDLLLAMGAGGRWASYNDGSIEFKRRWTVEELYEMVFVDAPTDMAMVQVVPQFEWFKVPTLQSNCSMSWLPGIRTEFYSAAAWTPFTEVWTRHFSNSSIRSTSSAPAQSSSITGTFREAGAATIVNSHIPSMRRRAISESGSCSSIRAFHSVRSRLRRCDQTTCRRRRETFRTWCS